MDTKLILTLLVAVLAYFYVGWRNDDANINGAVINAWTEIVVLPHKRFLTVLAGINACIDIIVPATVLLEELGAKDEGAADHPELSTLQNLVQTFKHFFQRGAAAERKFTDSHLFRNLTDTALRLQGSQQYVGGNAALIAQNMVTTFHDVQVNFIGPVGPQLRSFLHPRIHIRQASLQNSDEHHLIMEYQVGDAWANVTAPIATRFITSYDETNSRMVYVEAYFEELRAVSPDLAILTGFHMLDGLDEAFCSARLQLVAEMLASHPVSVPVHVELASIFNAHLIEAIGKLILPKATSLGLNEQELQQVSALLGGPHKTLHDTASSSGDGAVSGSQGQQPELHRVVDILTWLLHRYGRQSSGRLTRVHFHCLTFHVIAVLQDSGWSHTAAAVAAGTAKASKHACDMESLDLDPSRLEIRVPPSSRLHSDGPVVTFNPARPVTSFTHDGCEVAVSPVLVCKQPLKTVGLGDAISATGLMYSQFLASSDL